MSNEAEQFLGEAMTYSLIECIKEKFDELMQEQPDTLVQEVSDSVEKVSLTENKVRTYIYTTSHTLLYRYYVIYIYMYIYLQHVSGGYGLEESSQERTVE